MNHRVLERPVSGGLRAEPSPLGNGLTIVGPDGRNVVTVLWTPAGAVLRFEGNGLRLETPGTLALSADRVEIDGRQGVSIRSEGDLDTRARIQDHEATLGNVNIRANDDVRLNGERVMVNC